MSCCGTRLVAEQRRHLLPPRRLFRVAVLLGRLFRFEAGQSDHSARRQSHRMWCPAIPPHRGRPLPPLVQLRAHRCRVRLPLDHLPSSPFRHSLGSTLATLLRRTVRRGHRLRVVLTSTRPCPVLGVVELVCPEVARGVVLHGGAGGQRGPHRPRRRLLPGGRVLGSAWPSERRHWNDVSGSAGHRTRSATAPSLRWPSARPGAGAGTTAPWTRAHAR